MKFKQAIAFDGRNLNDIFRLPCVESIDKGEKGSHTLSCIVAVRRADW